MGGDNSNPNQATQYLLMGGDISCPNQMTQHSQMRGDISYPNQMTQHSQMGGDTSNPSQITQHPQIEGDTSNPKIPSLITQQKLPTLQGGGGRHFKPPHLETNNSKVKVHRNFNFLDYKFKPIKPKEGSTLISQERIEDVLNSTLESQEKINEELNQISW